MSKLQRSIAVIGQGFVGGTLAQVFAEHGWKVFAHDKAGKIAPGAQACDSVQKLWTYCEDAFWHEFSGIYFVCVPTPMKGYGQADTSIVEGVLDTLASYSGKRIAVVKSTVPPGSTERWNKKYEATGLRVVFNPEFLTEANALEDMRKQTRIVLGGPRPWIKVVKLAFLSTFPSVPIVQTSSTMAEMVKYFTNVHLAARVILSCEIAQVCEALDAQGLNIDYDKVVEYAKLDPRLGGSHMNVPGNDGIAGARGHCFPKDLGALIHVAQQAGVDAHVMCALRTKNYQIVAPDDRDWEKMVGRAVSDEG